MENFRTIKTFTHSTEIIILRSRLEAEGIECFLKDEYTVDANPFYSNAIGGVKLQVREKDVSKAMEILKDGGYLTDSLPYQPRLLKLFEKHSRKLPAIGSLRIEVRLMIIVSLIVLILSLILYFSSLPTIKEQLTQKNWCVDRVTHLGNVYVPNTISFIQISGGGYCSERIEIKPSGAIKLPGFDSKSTSGNWSITNDSLILSKSESFESLYNGKYSIEISGSELILESKTTKILCPRKSKGAEVTNLVLDLKN